jgi:hypothetical protein
MYTGGLISHTPPYIHAWRTFSPSHIYLSTFSMDTNQVSSLSLSLLSGTDCKQQIINMMGVSNYFSLKHQLWEFLRGEVPSLPTLKMRILSGKAAHLWACLPGREATSPRPKLPVLTANRPRSLLSQISFKYQAS